MLCVFLLLANLLVDGYAGLRHDSLIYLGQAFNQLYPGALDSDLFFAYGSQGKFTLFPRIYAYLIAQLGLETATFVLYGLSKCLYGAALAMLILRVFPPSYAFWAAAGALLLPGFYGGWGVFSYHEAFLTSRSLAEPLVLAALACWLHQRVLLALLLLLASLALHPLQGLVPLALLLLVLAGRFWVAALLIAALAVSVLAALSIEPFSWLLQRYDEKWWEAITTRNKMVVVSLWRAQDWAVVVADLAIVAYFLRQCGGEVARRLSILLLLIIAGLALSWLLGDLLRSRLVLSLQLWRGLWLLHLLANLAALPLALSLYRRSYELAAFMLLLAVLSSGHGYALLLLLLSASLVLGLERKITIEKRLVLIVPVVSLLAAYLLMLLMSVLADGGARPLPLEPQWLAAASLVIGAALYAYRYGATKYFWLFIALIAIAAGSDADRRNLRQRIVMAPQPPQLFTGLIEARHQVYWHVTHDVAWLVQKTPNYYAKTQGAGILFHRGTAMEYMHRREQLRFLPERFSKCWIEKHIASTTVSCQAAYKEAITACMRAPMLDFVVLQEDKSDVRAAGSEAFGGKYLNAYRCQGT